MSDVPDLIHTIDFAALYREQRARSNFPIKPKEAWNQRATDFGGARILESPYNADLISRMDLNDCRSVLDVGCGAGSLALLLAPRLEVVYAIDYSPAMLAALREHATARGLTNIVCKERAWEEHWDDIPQVDVVVASRSLEVEDAHAALEKMDRWALRRCYLTYKAGGSFVSRETLEALGRQVKGKPDYIYIVNMLYQMGIAAKVDFIEAPARRFPTESIDQYLQALEWAVGPLTAEERQTLQQKAAKSAREGTPRLGSGRKMLWALLSWEKGFPVLDGDL